MPPSNLKCVIKQLSSLAESLEGVSVLVSHCFEFVLKRANKMTNWLKVSANAVI